MVKGKLTGDQTGRVAINNEEIELTQEKQQRSALEITREMSGSAVGTNTLDNFTTNERKKGACSFFNNFSHYMKKCSIVCSRSLSTWPHFIFKAISKLKNYQPWLAPTMLFSFCFFFPAFFSRIQHFGSCRMNHSCVEQFQILTKQQVRGGSSKCS